jgi:hypothetical protein
MAYDGFGESRRIGLYDSHGFRVIDTLMALRALIEFQLVDGIILPFVFSRPFTTNFVDFITATGWTLNDFDHFLAS